MATLPARGAGRFRASLPEPVPRCPPLCHQGALTGWHSQGPAPWGHSSRCSCRFVCSGYLSCSRVSLWLHLKASPVPSSVPACHLRVPSTAATAGHRASSTRTRGTGAEEPRWFEKQPLLPRRFLESQVCPREVLPKLWVNPAQFRMGISTRSSAELLPPPAGSRQGPAAAFPVGALQGEYFMLHKDAEQGARVPSVTLGHSGCPLGAAGWLWRGDGRRSQHGNKQIDSEACPGAGGAARQPWPQSLAGTLLKFIRTSANNRSLAGS